ncbi:DnaJ-domain-containing protein, partial [Auriscalpium vulgare]
NPTSLFFDDDESSDLYAVLNVTSDANPDDIKKAYRKLALVYHPDKHAKSGEDARATASHKFQQIGFAYTILSDEKKRQRYDRTGQTDEGLEMDAGEDGWEAYFEELFDSVTKEKLDEMKKEYQGSAEEIQDLKNAYAEANGSLDEIMNHIPHSTHLDEERFIVIVSGLIKSGDLPKLATWESSTKDEKAKLVRKKQADKEATEAEKLARELGVWDEFYGSGKAGPRKGKGRGRAKKAEDDEEEDTSALQALILKKKQNTSNFLDNLAEKYAEPKLKSRGKRKGGIDDEEAEESPKKKRRGAVAEAPEIDDAEFEKLQKKLFGEKASEGSSAKGKKAGKGRKAK